MTGEYLVLVANCSDDEEATDSVISEYDNCFSIRLKPTDPIHHCYNVLVSAVATEYFTWLADDITLLQNLNPLLPILDDAYDVIALPMVDVLTYKDFTSHGREIIQNNDFFGCRIIIHNKKRLANHAIVKSEKYKILLSETTPYEQIDLRLHAHFNNAYWPQGRYLHHTRIMDTTRKNRIL